jgi:hypothetical protein
MGKARKTDITFDVSFAAQRIKHLSSEQVPKLMRHLLSRKESQLKAPRSDGHKPNSIRYFQVAQSLLRRILLQL